MELKITTKTENAFWLDCKFDIEVFFKHLNETEDKFISCRNVYDNRSFVRISEIESIENCGGRVNENQ